MEFRLIALFATLCLSILACVNGLAVMSVDLGSEWIKVGIVSPGVPMEIALNKESKRKSPSLISFKDNVRSFGEEAQTVGIRFPKNAYGYVIDLLGKDINHPLVKLYKERFPYYDIVENKERGTILFKHNDNSFYSPEEIVAQLLLKAKEMAEESAQQPIKECVITVPPYFNQVERKSLLQAASLAGLKVLQLMNDYLAVALNYGIFRSKEFNETAQYVLFYDMGASSTSSALVSYQTVKTKERGYVETHPQVSVLGVGVDRTLGGLEIQLRLRDYLAKKFNEMKKTKNDVFKNPRSMAKLFKEAGRVKNVLSANADHYAQIEGLLDDQDFKYQVTREVLENLVKDYQDRVGKPIEQALKTAHLTKDVISQVVLFGAGTRVPKIQEILQKIVGQDLAKNLNTDEAAALGAVYRAADLSTGFQVKKFITKDAVIYPIQIVFEREVEDGIKHVKRTLFGLMNPYPQKKIITFNKHTSDFSFKVNYADLDYLPESEIMNIGSLNLTEIKLIGVGDALRKNSGENIESKGIKAHFAMDDSGVLNLVNVELVVEKTVTETEEEGTLSKLGSTISKLFGGEDKPVEEKPLEEKPVFEELQEKPDESKNDTKEKTTNDTESKNATARDFKKELKPKVITIKEPIKASEKVLSIETLNKKQFDEALQKIVELDKIEKDLNRRASALNNLESFVIDIQTKLSEDDYINASSPDEIQKIQSTCAEISEWLYDEGSDADAETYEKKFESLRALTKDLFSRVWEHKERPDALNALHGMLNHSTQFMLTAKNLTKTTNTEKDVFTDAEVESLEKLIKETEEWRDKYVKEQEQLKKSEPIKLTVKMLTDKMAALDREVKYLVHKIKMWRPKTPPKEKENEEASAKEEKKEENRKSDAEGDTEGDAVTFVDPVTGEQIKAEEETIKPTKTTHEEPHTEL